MFITHSKWINTAKKQKQNRRTIQNKRKNNIGKHT